jgi:NAD(P)-dependent dehydrogenase (short-subunit alcohol dehydrogenase family)
VAVSYCSTGSYAIVTGASTGIGLELAKQLVDIGFNLLITGFEEADSGNALVLLQTRARRDQTIKVPCFITSSLSTHTHMLMPTDLVSNRYSLVTYPKANPGKTS